MKKNIRVAKRENKRIKIVVQRFPDWIGLIYVLLFSLGGVLLTLFKTKPGQINILPILFLVFYGIAYGVFIHNTVPLKIKLSIVKYISPNTCYVLNEKNGEIYKFIEGAQPTLYKSSYEEVNRDGININATNWKTFVVPKETNKLSKSKIALIISGGYVLMSAFNMVLSSQIEMNMFTASILAFGAPGVYTGLCVYLYFLRREENENKARQYKNMLARFKKEFNAVLDLYIQAEIAKEIYSDEEQCVIRIKNHFYVYARYEWIKEHNDEKANKEIITVKLNSKSGVLKSIIFSNSFYSSLQKMIRENRSPNYIILRNNDVELFNATLENITEQIPDELIKEEQEILHIGG